MAKNAKSKEAQIRFGNQELLGNGKLALAGEVFAADYVVHVGARDGKGLSFVKRFCKQLRATFPDLKVVDVQILAGTKDTVSWQRRLSGTHKVALRGIPPSGKRVTWHDMVVSRFEGGLIVEEWASSDLAAQMMFKLPRK